MSITLANRATLDYLQRETFDAHHYAFGVSEEKFGAAFARIRDTGVTFFAGLDASRPAEIYRSHGRHGTYFRDPNGHLMEILTPSA